MKCILTGEETLCKTKNVPLSHEGRRMIKEYREKVEKFNEERKKVDPFFQEFIMSVPMAIEDLENNVDIVANFEEALKKAEKEYEDSKGSEDTPEGTATSEGEPE